MSISIKQTVKLGIIISICLCTSSCAVLRDLVGLPESSSDLPIGEYLGTATLINNQAEDEAKEISHEIRIDFLPKEPGYTDGVGVMILQKNSRRFFWRNDGNNEDTWNIQFVKDNSIFTNIENSFRFTGIAKAEETNNEITGKLVVSNKDEEEDYFIEAYQIFPPVIIPPKEKTIVKAGEEMSLTAEKLGEDLDEVEIVLKSLDEEEKESKLKISSSAEGKDGATVLTLATNKDLSKGNYSLVLIRDGKHKSKSIPVEVQ